MLPPSGRVLEIASGSGEHALFFARDLPNLTWQPSDPDPAARESIRAWIAQENAENVLAPILLDMTNARWPFLRDKVDAVVCINMIHIAPWEACLGLLYGCEQLLPPGGPLAALRPVHARRLTTPRRRTRRSTRACGVRIRAGACATWTTWCARRRCAASTGGGGRDAGEQS